MQQSALSDSRVLARADGLWSALAEAPARWVSVCDGDGRLLFMNRSALVRLGRPATAVMNAGLDAVLRADAAEEHGRVLHDVVVSGRPLCLLGAEHGALVRTLFRRVQVEVGGPLVLITCGPAAEHDGKGVDGVRSANAECNDWGVLEALSLRELEVMRMVGEGMSSPEIAARLERSVKTIENHRLSITGKLSMKGRVDLVRLAISSGVAVVGDDEFAHFAGRWPRRPSRRPAPDRA